MKKNCFSVCFLVFVSLILFSGNILAAPTMGVATDTGEYAYITPLPPSENYIDYFADTLLPAVDINSGGFVLGASGGTLTVFTSYAPDVTQIYLLADTGGDQLPMTFGGDSLTLDNTIPPFVDGKADAYHDTPYSYVALSQNLDHWTTGVDFGSAIDFYLYTAVFTYTGAWTPGYYMFAAAETNDDVDTLYFTGGPGLKDAFSPKTGSAGGVPVPLPTTILLFGSGLISLAGFRRYKDK